MNVSVQANAKQAADRRDRFMAFVSDDQAEAAVSEAARRLLLPFASVQRGGIQAAIKKLGENRSPKFLLVDLSDSELPLSDMNMLADVCEPGVTVIAMGSRNDVGLFRDLLASGVSDYLVKPVTPELIQNALGKIVETGQPQAQPTAIAQKLGRLVAVMGTRGGVGASTVAVNCAWFLANEVKRRVALVDLDLQSGTTALYLDVEPSHGLREALEDPTRIDSLFIERVATKAGERLIVLSGEEPLDLPVAMDVPGVEALIAELRQQFHYVVVDAPRQFGPVAKHILETASSLVLVTDLTLPAVRETTRILQLANAQGSRAGRVVVANKTGQYGAGLVTKDEFQRQTGHGIDHEIPFDAKAVTESLLNGQPIVQQTGAIAKSLQELMDRLTGRPNAPTGNGTWLNKLLRRS